ncbi:MAG TPA: hypothetical protein VGQ83_16165 [Polyangia bacterium]
MTERFAELFLDHVATGWDRQMLLSELLDEHEWKLDLESGRIAFSSGGTLCRKEWTFAVEVLGTESDTSETWRWSWANPGGIPDQLTLASRRLQALGTEQGIPELAEPVLALCDVTGHELALCATSLLGADAYYRGPHGGGAVYVLIRDGAFPPPAVAPVVRLARHFPSLLATFDLTDHRRALRGFLRANGIPSVEREPRTLEVQTPGHVLVAAFDDANRLADLVLRPGLAP